LRDDADKRCALRFQSVADNARRIMPLEHLVPSPSQAAAGCQPDPQDDGGLNQFISISASMRNLAARAEVVARHVRLATIEGEAGAGKHTLATFLYQRALTAYPELAHSGFLRCDAREWLLDAADVGSISGFTYLDRVDLLAAPGQALLLRIVKDLSLRSEGAIVVASSESPLRNLVARGLFLPNLASLLAAVHFVIPPLRERRDEIVPFARHFLDRISRRCHLPRFPLSQDAIAHLLQHHWPGNIRELSSMLESAVLVCTDAVIQEEDLCISTAPTRSEEPLKSAENLDLDTVIQKHVCYVLELNRGNKQKAARQLGISRSTLYRMLQTANSAIG
jgi:DNA-binding NtrC family response regulator